MKIVDAFIFFNELELLEIRLNILNDKVDYFVLCESTISHSGKSKPLYYAENKHKFEKFNHKIIHHIVDDTPNSFEEAREMFLKETDPLKKNILLHSITTSNTGNEVQWLREFYQHESTRVGMRKANLDDDDICFISDLDEIWNPKIEYEFDDYNVTKLRQHVMIGFLNLRSNEPWTGTYYTKYKNIKNASANHFDTVSKTKHLIVDDGGWHFTYQGGIERIKTKLENYGHQEYNTTQVKDLIEFRLNSGMDVLGRPFLCEIREDILPDYLKSNKTSYIKMFK